MTLRNDKLVEVCDKCHRACCWYGEFICDEARTAGTALATVAELKALGLEHPENWTNEKFAKIYGTATPDFRGVPRLVLPEDAP